MRGLWLWSMEDVAATVIDAMVGAGFEVVQWYDEVGGEWVVRAERGVERFIARGPGPTELVVEVASMAGWVELGGGGKAG